MSKIFQVVMIGLLLVGCNPKSDDALNIMVPLGAPSIPFIDLMNDETVNLTFVNGTDPLLAAFINPNQELDIIVAPMNIGISLLNRESTNYKLWGVLTWGNLVVVAPNSDALEHHGQLALFGQNTIIEHISEQILYPLSPSLDPVYYPSVADAFVSLMSNKSEAALLAQPFAQVAIYQAAQQNKELKIILDVAQAYKQATGLDNYPQAAIFILDSSYQSKQVAIDKVLTNIDTYIRLIHQSPEQLELDLNRLDASTLGLPQAAILTPIIDQLHLRLVNAQQAEKQINALLDMLGLSISEQMILN